VHTVYICPELRALAPFCEIARVRSGPRKMGARTFFKNAKNGKKSAKKLPNIFSQKVIFEIFFARIFLRFSKLFFGARKNIFVHPLRFCVLQTPTTIQY
jgi:hypothetical protein